MMLEEELMTQHNLEKTQLNGQKSVWLQKCRAEALAYFVEHGFPTQRDEEWKYTNLNRLKERHFDFAGEDNTQVDFAKLKAQLWWNDAATNLVFVNGHLQREGSTLSAEFAKLLHENFEYGRVKSVLSQSAINQRDAFTAMNTAYFNEGALIELPPHTKLQTPIYIIAINTNTSAVQSHLRHLIFADAQSEATIIEVAISSSEVPYFSTSMSQIYLQDGAKLTHYHLAEVSDKSILKATILVEQNESSEFVSHSVALSGEIVRADIDVQLNEKNAVCCLHGLYRIKEQDHVDHHTTIQHACSFTQSKQNYKGVVAGKARAVFNGKVIVKEQTHHIIAHQKNNNLLLSNDAEIDTKPQLEIFSDDVQCTHGATVGQLDNDALFYLRSRGVDENSAKQMLIAGFAREVIEKISWGPVKNWIEAKLKVV